MPKEPLFEAWAKRQGVTRPFTMLCGMEVAARRQIAEMLEVDLNEAFDEGVNQALYDMDVFESELLDDPETYAQIYGELPFDPERPCDDNQAEACLIIGMDRKGIQARSHGTLTTLNPFAKNHAWAEVLVGVIEEFQILGHVWGKTEEELESAIFDYFAAEEWARKGVQEKHEIQKFINEQPELIDRLKAVGFNQNKQRWIVNMMFQAAKRGGFKTYINAVKVAAWMNRELGTKIMMKTAAKGLATALRAVNVALWAWLVWDVLSFFFGPSRKRLIPVVALIHQQDLLGKLEQ